MHWRNKCKISKTSKVNYGSVKHNSNILLIYYLSKFMPLTITTPCSWPIKPMPKHIICKLAILLAKTPSRLPHKLILTVVGLPARNKPMIPCANNIFGLIFPNEPYQPLMAHAFFISPKFPLITSKVTTPPAY